MSLQSEINKYVESKEFKEKVNSLSKTNANFGKLNGSGGAEKFAKQCGEELRGYLIESINNLDSEPAKKRFLDAIIVNHEFIKGTGWIVNICFDEKLVSSKSLWDEGYPNGAYLPTLFNNGYSASDYVYGCDNHGEYIRSKIVRQGYNFIKCAVDKYNSVHNGDGTKAEYNEIYKDGTLGRGGLASLYF